MAGRSATVMSGLDGDSANSSFVLGEDLSGEGIVAVGHGELAFMLPDVDGLALYRWPLRAGAAVRKGVEVSP